MTDTAMTVHRQCDNDDDDVDDTMTKKGGTRVHAQSVINTAPQPAKPTGDATHFLRWLPLLLRLIEGDDEDTAALRRSGFRSRRWSLVRRARLSL